MAEHGSFVWSHWAEKVCWLIRQDESRFAVSCKFLWVQFWYKLLIGFENGNLLFQRPRVCIRGDFDVEIGAFPYYGGKRSLSPGED